MGGRGSGRRAEFGPRCDSHHKIDLTWLRREGFLRPGQAATLTWSTNGQRTGSIKYVVETSGLRLIYRVLIADGTWEDVEEFIDLTTTQPYLGGSRCWFECPSCERRCRILYGGRRFRCRKCLGLTYESQHEDAVGRATSQAHKLRDRLGQHGSLADPFPQKPKGMRWSTYERLRTRDAELRHRWGDGVTKWLRKLGVWPPDE